MKVLLAVLAVLLALIVRSAAVAETSTASAPAVESLVTNGMFEKATKDASWPDDWGKPPKEGKGTYETEGDVKFIRLVSTEPDKNVMIYRRVYLPKNPPAALEIFYKVRVKDVKAGKNSWFDARIMANFKDKDDKVLKPSPAAPAFKGTSKDWVEKSYIVAVPKGASYFEIMPCLFNVAAGTFDIARYEAFPASEDRLPKPPPPIPSETKKPAEGAKLPPELHVDGTELKTADGKVVWLQGLSVDSLQWSAGGDKIDKSIPVAIDQWKANCIRLAVKDDFWFGRSKWQKDGGLGYRRVVDAAIDAASSRGAYVALDLHRFRAPLPEHVEFWKDAATRYKNHPGVLFELFNEPHSLSWKVWRDGGSMKEHKDVGVAEEVGDNTDGETTVGMQALVNAVRESGAKNIVIAGGLAWGYDLSGVVKGYALDDKGGNGVVYSSHLYPWKKDWQKNTLDAAAKFPLFIGEVGCPQKWEDFSFIKPGERYEDLSKGEWPPDVLGMIQKNKLNWTGFSFHPKCGPMVILDWDYTPTPYWGVFVKEALAGKQFEMKRMR